MIGVRVLMTLQLIAIILLIRLPVFVDEISIDTSNQIAESEECNGKLSVSLSLLTTVLGLNTIFRTTYTEIVVHEDGSVDHNIYMVLYRVSPFHMLRPAFRRDNSGSFSVTLYQYMIFDGVAHPTRNKVVLRFPNQDVLLYEGCFDTVETGER
jgi:hypothetical protein